MIEWLAVILLIAVGIGMIVAEIIFIPGVTVVGLLGIVFVVAGVLISFLSFDQTTGFIVLGASVVAGAVALFIGLKGGAWDKFSLKTTIDSRINEGQIDEIHEGDSGTTISALRPIGKAEFGNNVAEVCTSGNFLNPGIKIRVVQITGTKILVEPINE
jgi:membrane-bound ClpP family serine protease